MHDLSHRHYKVVGLVRLIIVRDAGGTVDQKNDDADMAE